MSDTRHIAVYHEGCDREYEEYALQLHSRASFQLLRHASTLSTVRPTSGSVRHATISAGSVWAWNAGLRQSSALMSRGIAASWVRMRQRQCVPSRRTAS